MTNLRLECVECAEYFDTIEDAYQHEVDVTHPGTPTFLIAT